MLMCRGLLSGNTASASTLPLRSNPAFHQGNLLQSNQGFLRLRLPVLQLRWWWLLPWWLLPRQPRPLWPPSLRQRSLRRWEVCMLCAPRIFIWSRRHRFLQRRSRRWTQAAIWPIATLIMRG